MKKAKSKNKSAKLPADLWAPFPQKIENWTKEDHALNAPARTASFPAILGQPVATASHVVCPGDENVL